MSPSEYKAFVGQRGTDTLSVLLKNVRDDYDASDSEDDELVLTASEAADRVRLTSELARLRANKAHYSREFRVRIHVVGCSMCCIPRLTVRLLSGGTWNAQTVLLGGLGWDPGVTAAQSLIASSGRLRVTTYDGMDVEDMRLQAEQRLVRTQVLPSHNPPPRLVTILGH